MQTQDHVDRPSASWTRIPQALLASRYVPLTAAGIATLLTLSSLHVGWVGDDHYQRAVLTSSSVLREYAASPMDMFMFFDGDPHRTGRMIDRGFIPWWTYEHIKAAFWRPLTVLTHWIDYQLWPEHPVAMHAHSIAWLAAVVAAVAVLYRRFLTPPWLAGLAALFYALDDAHAMPVGFLANRNVLISTMFGVLALLAHDRWRREGRGWGAIAASVFLLLSLLAKEAGIATCAYLAAHAFVFERGRWWRRLLVLVPYAVIVVAWRAVWTGLGYGVAHAGLYIDPLQEPVRFLASLPGRVPILLLGQFALPPAEIGLLPDPAIVWGQWVLAVVFVIVLVLVFTPVWRRDPMARFWAIGLLFALPPICTTFPADRLLMFVGIGGMGLAAQLFRLTFGDPAGRPPGRAWRVLAVVVCVVFGLVHGLVAPVALVVRAAHPTGPKRWERFSIPVPPDPRIAEQDMVVVNPPSVLHAAHFLVENEMLGRPVPRHARFLAPGLQSVMIHRLSRDALAIRPENGFLAWVFESLFRNGAFPLLVGRRIELTGMTVEITELTPDGRPAEAVFHFAVPLEDPSLHWMQWKDDQFRPFTPPAVGERIELVFNTRLF